MDLEEFLKPLYQEVDGVSRFDEIERVARLARTILGQESRELDLLALFQGLGSWLDKVGNLSRTLLAVPELGESELRRTAASIQRLDAPQTNVERAVAAAMLIDRSGVHGLAQRFAAARREGHSITDVVREALADSWIPDWIPDNAKPMLEERLKRRREFCRLILEELTS